MNCYRNGGCGPYEMTPCNACPASKPDYIWRSENSKKRSVELTDTLMKQLSKMSDEEVVSLIRKALDLSNIPYKTDVKDGKVIFTSIE